MAAVGTKDTGPELAVRRALHAAGLRYRLHVRGMPGTPDVVLPGRRAVVEVRGCFWHQHPGCRNARLPATRQDYWLPKLAANVARDARNTAALEQDGWHVIVVWACGTDNASLAALAASISGLPSMRQTRVRTAEMTSH